MKNRLLFYAFFALFLLFLIIFKPGFEQKYLVSGDEAIIKIINKIPLVSEIDYVTYGACPKTKFGSIILNCYFFPDYKATKKILPGNKIVIFIDSFERDSFNNEQLFLLNKARAKDMDVNFINFEDGYYFDLNKKNKDTSTYLAFVGDTNFADRGYDYYLRKGKKDLAYYKYFFDRVKFNPFTNESFLKSFDGVIANLETTIYSPGTVCNSGGKSIVLKTKEKYLNFFKDIGITHLNISNNHSYDCGNAGFKLTKDLLKKNNYPFFGEGRDLESNILKTKIDNKKFMFIGMNDSTFHSPFDKLKKEFDKFDGFKIANFHWGNEYKLEGGKRQKELAKKFNNVDLIIGHHPHVVENYEQNNGIMTYYSLGNFLFDQPFEDTLKGMMVVVEVKEDGTLNSLPIYFKRDNEFYNIIKFVK